MRAATAYEEMRAQRQQANQELSDAAVEIARLKVEVTALRAALIQSGRAVGALLTDDVSSEFLTHVPAEVEAVMRAKDAEIERLKHEWSDCEDRLGGLIRLAGQERDALRAAREQDLRPVSHDEVLAFQAASGHSLQAMSYACIASGVLAARRAAAGEKKGKIESS